MISPVLNSGFIPPAALVRNNVSTPKAFITRIGIVVCKKICIIKLVLTPVGMPKIYTYVPVRRWIHAINNTR
jgi:hypothetical protein